jgi:hypothetical protein
VRTIEARRLDIARVLRRRRTAGERFGLGSIEEAQSLLDLEALTGAVGAGTDELAALVDQPPATTRARR